MILCRRTDFRSTEKSVASDYSDDTRVESEKTLDQFFHPPKIEAKILGEVVGVENHSHRSLAFHRGLCNINTGALHGRLEGMSPVVPARRLRERSRTIPWPVPQSVQYSKQSSISNGVRSATGYCGHHSPLGRLIMTHPGEVEPPSRTKRKAIPRSHRFSAGGPTIGARFRNRK